MAKDTLPDDEWGVERNNILEGEYETLDAVMTALKQVGFDTDSIEEGRDLFNKPCLLFSGTRNYVATLIERDGKLAFALVDPIKKRIRTRIGIMASTTESAQPIEVKTVDEAINQAVQKRESEPNSPLVYMIDCKNRVDLSTAQTRLDERRFTKTGFHNATYPKGHLFHEPPDYLESLNRGKTGSSIVVLLNVDSGAYTYERTNSSQVRDA